VTICEELRPFLVRHGLTWPACERLMALGVDGKAVMRWNAACAIGQARVQLYDRFWEPVGPDARLLLACHDDGHLIDIAAVSTKYPEQVALRTGLAWCLGDDLVQAARSSALAERRATLRLVADPMEWLRSDGRAVCVLDWAQAVRELRALGERVTLECDAGTGEQLRARLKRGGLPKVTERAPQRIAA